MIRPILVVLSLAVIASPSPVHGGFTVEAWNLKTSASERVNGHSINDSETITSISNPLLTAIYAQVNDNSFSETEFNYAWFPSLATGHFNATITHAIRAPEARAVTDNQIFILPSEDLHLSISASLMYAHTPGDLGSVNFFTSIRDEATQQSVLSEHRRGGNLYFEPASGTLTINEEIILIAGTTYRLRNGIDSSNTADLLPTGIIDVSADISFTITPVPEPASLAMAALAAPWILRRRRSGFLLRT